MHRHTGLTAALLLGGLVFACGGSQPAMQVEFQTQALLEEADFVVLYLYANTSSCAAVRAQDPRPPSILGPYRSDIDAEGRDRGIVSRIGDPVPVGSYTVFVDAFANGGRRVGTGCAPDQEVFNREVSTIKVVVSEN